ncbi:reverse transcriptase [Lasius niger]|uniref:Reverse transcriptase n=1 Tax=Lasius niger TaxID=67767 RepID=A0A0J7K811_LASNI|nr:reverse transcriptase [Lasius niger]
MSMNLEVVSTGEPTYWPTEKKKILDIIDICVTRGISKKYLDAESCLDLSSDHSPIIITINSQILKKEKPPMLCNKHTDWTNFRKLLEESLVTKIPLKTAEDIIEAAEHFNQRIQQAVWNSTPTSSTNDKEDSCSMAVRDKIASKRKLRKQWQKTRSPELKAKLNKAVKEIRAMLTNEKKQAIDNYLINLGATEATDYSLWKATKKLKQPQISISPIRTESGKWAKSNEEKAELFANNLNKVFAPNLREIPPEEEEEIHQSLKSDYQPGQPIKKFNIKEIEKIILTDLNIRKNPGYDLITAKILKELPSIGHRYLTHLYNAILRTSFFPSQWKVAQIIMIPKLGKTKEEVTLYRPISLLPIAAKVFEKLLLKRLLPIIEEENLIPNHQFGFRRQHTTIEQVHRIVNKIHHSLEGKRFCSAAFLDITQAFDKVWHTGLLYKIKRHLPMNFNLILKSYLENRHLLVKYQDATTNLHLIKARVLQGSVLGPVLYLIFTKDLPTSPLVVTATFADDTAVQASSSDPAVAFQHLQLNLNEIQSWLRKWRIRVNESKFVHITFTTRRETCPPVTLNNQLIPQSDVVKYLEIHLDRKLTWQKHIFTKRKQLGLKLSKMYWLVGHRSKLSVENKLLLYKAILKPIWTYDIQLWGSAAKSNIEILQRFQSKVLRLIINVFWLLHKELQVLSVKDEVSKYSTNYHDRLTDHPNALAIYLMKRTGRTRRLKLTLSSDLAAF